MHCELDQERKQGYGAMIGSYILSYKNRCVGTGGQS